MMTDQQHQREQALDVQLSKTIAMIQWMERIGNRQLRLVDVEPTVTFVETLEEEAA